MRRLLGILFTWAIMTPAACSDDPASSAPADGGAPQDTGRPDTGPTETDSGADTGDGNTCVPPTTPPVVVFLNRAGGTYSAGQNDSRANTTALDAQTNTITPWTVSEASWKLVMSCMKKKFEPFNVNITDTDPGTAEHIEIVFSQPAAHVHDATAHPTQLAFAASGTCGITANAIAFVNTAYAEATVDMGRGCAGAAYAVGLALGAESVTSCPDAMSDKRTDCPFDGFTDVAITCGTTAAADCRCGETPTTNTQNSFQKIKKAVGGKCQ